MEHEFEKKYTHFSRLDLRLSQYCIIDSHSVGGPVMGEAGINEAKTAYEKEEYEKAFAEFSIAAEQGDAEARYFIGIMYQNGTGPAEDNKKAAEWYLKAAKQDNPNAQNALGLMYCLGLGVPQKRRVAEIWFRRAAEQGYSMAQHNLGILL